MSPNSEVQEILVLEPDRICAAVLARTVSCVFPKARVYCESEPGAAAIILAQGAIDLFVVAVRGFDLDVITLLSVWAEHDRHRTRVLVVTPDAKSTALTAIRSLPITGIFDTSSSDLRELESACRTVASGATYMSHTAVAQTGVPFVARATDVAVRIGKRSREPRQPGRGVPPPDRVRHTLHRRRWHA